LPATEADWLVSALGALDLDPAKTGVRDFLETAEIVAGLDMVVSVDTSVAHLAGAMGKPVFLLLSAFGVDWRWQISRETSPWYPTVRLSRQERAGDWRATLERVVEGVREG
jgi:ADP-heptose:LPS heptosyltransferase